MASSYSTDLKLELMVTGENSGTWGDKTNTNLNLLQQAIAGYQSIALTSTNTTLAMTNATISDARNAVIKFTGTLSANTTVYVDSGIEKTYIIENGTTGAYTLALNQVGGNSVIFGTTDKTSKIVYLDGTNANDLGLVNLTAPQTLTNKTLTSPVIDQINDSNGNEEIKFTTTASAVNELTVANAATGNAPEISATGNDTNIDIKITPKGSGKVNIDGIKYPNTDGSAGQLLSTDGSGNLSFITVSSEAQFIAGSLPLATNKSTTARKAVSISKATGEVGAYPVLNVFSSTTKTVTTTSVVNYSLDGSFGIIIGSPNATTRSFIGVYTPSNGTPVIGNTSVLLSVNQGDPSQQNYSFAGYVQPISSDIFLAYNASKSYANPNFIGGIRALTMRVNTSGAISAGNVTSTTWNTGQDFFYFPTISQLNQTTYGISAGYAGVTTDTRLLGLSTNLTTLNLLANNASGYPYSWNQRTIFNQSVLDTTPHQTVYYPANSTVYFVTVNATTRLVSAEVQASIATNFYQSAATWSKVGNYRWLAIYQNATTLAYEVATFDVNGTTLAFTSIHSTSRLYAPNTQKFVGYANDYVNNSTNLTTAALFYSAGLGYNVNTLRLSTDGVIMGYNVGTYLGIAGVSPYFLTQDPNVTTGVEIINAFTNISSQYKNLIVNAASTDQFNYCGIATANDSTSPVTVIQNGIQDGHTGLSIGSTYYVEFDGNLTTIATNISAGVAVTSTQLQIRQVNI